MSVFWFFLRKFLWRFYTFFIESYKNEIFIKNPSIYTKIQYLYDIYFPTKNWIFAIFFKKVSIDGFTHYLWKILLIFIVQSFKNEISSKILDIQKYNIVRHWFSSKNWIFAIFFKKVSIDGFTHSKMKFHQKSPVLHILWKILLIFIVQSFKNEISSKILDTQKYNIVRHWFSSINWIFSIFFKKVSIDGFTHFSSKIHPKFSKNRLFHIPQYIIYLWSEFYARSNNQTIRIFG